MASKIWNQWKPGAQIGTIERYFEGEGSKFYRERVQDVAPILDRHRRVANATDGKTEGGGRFIGSIPNVVYYDWIAEWQRQGLIDPNTPGGMRPVNDLIRAKLRDSDFSKLRATHGGI